MIHTSLKLLAESEGHPNIGATFLPFGFPDDRYCKWRWERASNCYIACLIAKTVERESRREVNRLGLIYCRWSACKTHFGQLCIATPSRTTSTFCRFFNIRLRFDRFLLVLMFRSISIIIGFTAGFVIRIPFVIRAIPLEVSDELICWSRHTVGREIICTYIRQILWNDEKFREKVYV